MPVNIGISRIRSLFSDVDNDGQPDPGDTFHHTIVITNTGTTATNVVDSETENGLTIDPLSVKIGPIAFDDSGGPFDITGNTPVTFTVGQLLGNDVDPDGDEANLHITSVGNAAGGTVVLNDNGTPLIFGDDTITFTPTTGLDIGQTATFTYSIVDEQGLDSVAATPGTVTLNVTDVVWYVDKDYAGANGASDGSFLRPFTDVSQLNGAGGAGDVDGANETIFITDRAGNDVTANLELENGQKLFGDSHAFIVNGHTVGVSTSNSTIDHSAAGITLASGNTIDGIDLTSSSTSAVGIQDGGGTVGSLTITNTSIAGSGQIIDIDQGGTLAVSLAGASSNGSTGSNGGVIDITGVSGSFTITGPVTINGTQGQTGIDISNNNDLAVSFQGLTTVNSAANAAINLSSNTGTSTMGFTGGLDIDTTSGTGFSANAAGTLTITGGNAIDTATGQILNIVNNGIGSGNVAFATLTSTGTVAGNAINLSNVSGTNALSANTVTIAGATGNGINLLGGSSANVSINSATINNTGGDGIQVNGHTGTFTVTGGNIGNSNDPGGDTVNITGGTGAVSIGANLFKSSAGNIVEVSNHGTGNVTFSGNLSATAGLSNGILLSGNTGGNITFSGASKVLNTGGNTALTFSNTNATGATVAFQNGGLDIDTTTGTGINATSTTIGAGSLSITGSGNSVNDANGGRAVILDGVSSGGITFDSINVGNTAAGNGTAIFLKNAGTGGFTVTGNASVNGSGGTLNFASGGANGDNTQGVGVYLENVSNVSLSNMNFTGTFSNFGIRGLGVDNFTLRDSVLNSTYGTTATEGAIRFGNQGGTTGLTGTALFEGNTVGGSSGDNLGIFTYGANSLNLTIRDTVGGDSAIFNANNSTTGQDGIIIETGGTSTLVASITGVDFNGARGDQIQIAAVGSTNQNLAITGNSFDQSIAGALGGGVRLGGGGNGNFTVAYNFSGNTMTGATATAIDALYNGLNGTITGVIANNVIGTTGGGFQNSLGQVGSIQGFGIRAAIDKTTGGTMTYAVRISNNQIHDTADAGIYLVSNNGGNTGLGRLEATVTSNTVAEQSAAIDNGGLYAQIGGSGFANDNALLGLNLTSNSIQAATNNAVIFDQLTSAARFYLPGYGGSANGEFNGFGAAGTASSGINSYFAGKGNTLINGVGAPEPGGVNAESVFQVTGASFVLPVPILAAPQPGEDWETALQAKLSANTPATPAPVTPDPGSGGDPIHPVFNDTQPGGKGAPATIDDGLLTQAKLDVLVQAAIQRWADAGATPEQLAAMRATSVGLADMTGAFLAASDPRAITVDTDGAGHGWFIDSTPGDDSEFQGSGSRLTADAGGAADGRMDLLTVVMHELGHQVGLEDLYLASQSAELMYGYENIGERRLPQADDLATADLDAVPHGAFLLSPITIGTLPDNHAVQITFTSTVNSFNNQVIPTFNNTSTVSFNEAGSPVTSSNEALAVDSLTLGDRVFNDANNNGVLDAGETGIAGVALTLYADNGNGVFDFGPDTQIAITTTDANGNYSFANLAPGDYLVGVDASNFNIAGALNGLITTTGVSDPDNNIDNDDNGIEDSGFVVSQAITLAYNTEPTAGTGNDTNNTLDFGFVEPNETPVITVPGAQAPLEDVAFTFSTSNGNLISIADPDAGAGFLTVVIGAGNGTLTLNGTTGLAFTFGDGTADQAMTFSGTLSDINTALDGLTYLTDANFNGADQLTVFVTDNGNTGADPGLTGGPDDEQDLQQVDLNVVSVNDPPSGLDDSATVAINTTYTFTAADFNFSDPVEGDAFAGVLVTSVATDGKIQLNNVDVIASQFITAADIASGLLTFVPDTGESGVPYATFTFQVRDGAGILNGGTDTDPSANTFTVNVTADAAPVLDLNGAGGGIDSTASYTENAAPTLLAPGAVVTDADNANLSGATVSIAGGFLAGFDVLTVNGATSGTVSGITFSFNSGTGVLTLSGSATLASYQTLLDQVGFNSTSNSPGTSRLVSWTVNDGTVNSATALTNVTVTPVEDPAVANNDAFATNEATAIGAGLSLYNNNGSGIDSDADGPALLISAVNGDSANVGTPFLLPSGALLTVNPNGTFSYDPNHAFDATPTAASGASNTPAHDSFTYTLSGGNTATVSLTITGLDSNDELFGTGGNDALSGGTGNDLYHVDNGGDLVFEANGAGNDRILTSVTYNLPGNAFVETLEATAGVAPINLTGNYLVNTLIGNNGDNVLHGAGGSGDVLIGRGGNDVYLTDVATTQVVETSGGGFDQLFTSVSYVLGSASIEVLSANSHAATTPINLTGNGFNQQVLGNNGNNVLHGGGGVDVLIGYGGNDTYLTDVAATQVMEAAGGGKDQVFTSVSYALASGSEIEVLSTNSHAATTAINLTGNNFAQELWGNAGANILDGKAGHDSLIGLGGADTFAFTSALGGGNVDVVADFAAGVDKIGLDDAIFTAVGASLDASEFVIGTAAADADDRIIYNSATGALYYDADGNGAGAAVQFAILQGHPIISVGDFAVI